MLGELGSYVFFFRNGIMYKKSLEIRAKYVARKIARFDAGVVVANALSDRCWFSCMSQE